MLPIPAHEQLLQVDDAFRVTKVDRERVIQDPARPRGCDGPSVCAAVRPAERGSAGPPYPVPNPVTDLGVLGFAELARRRDLENASRRFLIQ